MNPANKWLIGSASAALIAGAAQWEGFMPVPYRDIAGVATYCYGETKGVTWGKTYTKEQCMALLRPRLAEFGKGVLQCVNVPLKQNQYDAYTLFAYNVGVHGFCSSRALKLLNQGRYEEACKALATGPTGQPAWSFAGGKYVQGLQNRRQYEVKMCLG